MSTAAALEVRALDVCYGRIQTLCAVSLRVARGELVTIVGPNGAGKTTLLRAIAGVVPSRTGTITFEGRSISGQPTERIVRLGLAMVPEGRDLFPPLTVRENLLLGAYCRSRAERRASMATDLENVVALFGALGSRLDRPAGTLSGGEQQMLAIGRALMARPRMLLLDEPSVGLAPLVIGVIFRALETLKREGLTILLVEQNARAALKIADRGYTLLPGGIIRDAGGDDHVEESARRAYGLETAEEVPRG